MLGIYGIYRFPAVLGTPGDIPVLTTYVLKLASWPPPLYGTPRRSPSRVQAGEPVRIAVRAANVRLGVGGAAENSFTARVADTRYQGTQTRYELELLAGASMPWSSAPSCAIRWAATLPSSVRPTCAGPTPHTRRSAPSNRGRPPCSPSRAI